MDISGKTAFITGSSRGIGQQIALGLAEKKCKIILHGRSVEGCQTSLQLLNEMGATVHVVSGDLSTEKGVMHVIDQLNTLAIPIDILYNNAAIMTEYREAYWNHTWDDWIETMKVNVIALYSICGAIVPSMMERNFGRVINLISGIENTPELAPYGASKWAVIKHTEDLAFKCQNSNVRINSLDPGWLVTDMGGTSAPNEVKAVLPGALKPALIKNDGPNGQIFRALDFRTKA